MCSVVGCDSGRRNVQRFKLPEDPEMRLEWVQFLFEVNAQRLKESSWTDITICSEHFADGCFVNVTGTVLLRSGAVPSLCVKPEPEEVKSEEVEPSQEPVETIDVACQCDPVETCDSPSSCSEESEVNSVAAQESPVPHDATDAFVSDYSQMLQKVVNIDIIREKAALLQMKGKYVVNENRLLQLFSPKCPLCHSQVKMEKFTYGLIIILNQQCLQCEYRNQWKSQVNASVPRASGQHLTEGVAVTPETPQTVSTDDDNNSSITGVPELVADIDDESDPMTKSKESSDGGDTNSDEDWSPVNEFLLHNKLHNDDSDEESENGDDDPDPLVSRHSQLCTDCGKFYNKWKPHTCVHKIKPYSCNICGKRCVSEVSLNSHSKVHDENYEYPCQYCHVTFKTKVDKINHEQTHLNQEKPYKCPDCSEAYATNKERVVHVEDHRGPRQYKCNVCRITFYCFTSLQRHLAVHTGVKPFKCSVCQRGFNQASHLKSHMRLHTGERPYKCQHCDKCFNHNVSLKSHVQRYHTPSSGQERKKGKTNKTVSNTVDTQENGNKKDTDSGLDNVEEEHDKDEKVQEKRTNKLKRRSTGRPRGRPKRNAAGNLVLVEEMQGQCSDMTATVNVQRSKRTGRRHDEGDPTKSDTSFDLAEEEEKRSEKVTLSTSRSRRKAKKI